MPSLAPPKFRWQDLPCTEYNGLRAFTIYVDTCEADPTKVPLPELGVTWAASPSWVKKVEQVVSSLRGYTLKTHSASGAGRVFTYGPVLTDAQRSKPFYVEEESRQQFWPTVLQKLWFTKNISTGALSDHSKYRVGNTYPTTARIKHYISDKKWPKRRFNRPFPLTDTVKWTMPTNSGSFPECLHPYCRFPTQQSTETTEFGLGTIQTEIGSDLIEQEFPATTMEDWESYEAEILVNKVAGFWHYVVTELLPPIDDREITT